MSDVAKTPREELQCKKKYLYEYSMFWECNDGSKCQILEEDVCEKLNEQQATINELKEENDKLIQKNCIPCELVNLQTREIDKLKEENEKLRQQLKEKEEDERLYANEILELRETNKEHIKFKSLGGNY